MFAVSSVTVSSQTCPSTTFLPYLLPLWTNQSTDDVNFICEDPELFTSDKS